MRGAESYVGFYQPFSDTWGASVELGVMQSGPLALRRYSLASQLQTAFAGGSSLSVGLKYRVYEPDPGLRPYADMLPNGYTLVPGRVPGVSYGPSYQFNLNYQYSAAHAFALALGRELETFTPAFDLPGGARQFSLTGEHWLTPSWALSYDLLSTDPSNAFRFQGLRFGVRYRF
jgi:YaiO family outer membrane protein